MHSRAQDFGVSRGNAGDQVGGAGERQCARKAADDGDDFPLETEVLQRRIDRPAAKALPRHADVPAGRVTGGGDRATDQRVPRAHDADETVAEQCLHTQLRGLRLTHDAGLQVDDPVTK